MLFHLQEANTFLSGQKTQPSGGPELAMQADAASDRRRAKRPSIAFASMPDPPPPAPEPAPAEAIPTLIPEAVEIVRCVDVESPIPAEPDESAQVEPASESVPEPHEEVMQSLPTSIRQSMDRLEEPLALPPPPATTFTLPDLSLQFEEYDEPLPEKWDWNIKERDLVRAHGCMATSVLEKYVNAVHSQTALARELGANRVSAYRVRNEAHLGQIAREEYAEKYIAMANAAKRCEAGNSCWKSRLDAEVHCRRRVMVR
ncbi:hypothetical protein HDU86_006795 [Geranomyces michiganensis]|nr:hypothetical protein HDU86_006795 [Geranomyces michiganensis]